MRAASSAGFTLLEILVALVVFGLLMVGLAQGVHFGLHARSMQASMVDRQAGLETTDHVLRDLVEQMDPGTAERPPHIIGNSHSLAFPTTLPNGADGLTRQQADVALLVDGAHHLLLRWTPRLHAIRFGSPPAPAASELLGNVDHIDLAYWTAAANGGGEWVESWHGSPLPALVRIRLVFVAGDRRHWPELIVATARQPAGT